MSSLSEKNNQIQSEFQQNLDLLREVHFFAELPMEALKVIAYLCNRTEYSAGETLFSQGEDDGQAFLILSGIVELFRQKEGGEEQLLKKYDQSSFIGGLSLLGNTRRIFSLKAATEVTTIRIEREKFTKSLEQFPDITTKIFAAILSSIEGWEQQSIDAKIDGCPICKETLGVSLL